MLATNGTCAEDGQAPTYLIKKKTLGLVQGTWTFFSLAGLRLLLSMDLASHLRQSTELLRLARLT